MHTLVCIFAFGVACLLGPAKIEHMSDTRVVDLISQVTTGLEGLAAIMASPESVAFASVRASFEELEVAMNRKAAIDASFAWLANLHEAGRVVGSTSTTQYLREKLGLSRNEAFNRLRQGAALYDPVPEPAPEPPSATESEDQRLAREAEERRRAEEEAAAQRRARQQAAEASAEKRRIIEAELGHLSEHADPGANVLREQSLKQAAWRGVEDLRAWVRDRVREANARGRKPDGFRDRFAAAKKRYISFGQQDADGGVRISGYLPAAQAAALKAALSYNQSTTWSEEGDEGEKDKRSLGQRRADKLHEIVRGHSADAEPNRGGIGSVVVSVTLSELEEMGLDTFVPTNTGVYLSPLDMLVLGEASCDWITVHDDRGALLTLGRGKRTANLEQRIALLVTELTCSHPGCDHPVDDCQVHHIIAWILSGRTDIENLTLLCRMHHRDNNDKRDGSRGMGHAERDPGSGRVGHRAAGSSKIRLNNSVAAGKSASARIRRRYAPPDPDSDALFTV